MSSHSIWPALAGYALGSAQILAIDWLRSRIAHRRHLRLLRAELRRLATFEYKWNWEHGKPRADDKTAVAPTITPSYQRLLQDIDLWLTDAHSDDNTLQGLIDIADGAVILQRYVTAVNNEADLAGSATVQSEREKHCSRAIDTAQIYDKELDRWRTLVGSAMIDASRRLRIADLPAQVRRLAQRMPKGTNPPPLAPIDHPPSER